MVLHGCVLLGQYCLVNKPFLSFMDSNGWFISMFCLSWTILVGISSYVVCDEQKCWYITRFCLLWTVMVGISPSFFCRGQNWLVYQPD